VLEFYIGSFSSPSYGVWWDGRQLVYESFVSGYEQRRQVFMNPSGAQWARFWQTMDSVSIWDWADQHEPGALRNDTHWSMTLQHGDRRVESAGDNSNDDDEIARFGVLTEAISRLAGGAAFT
jgi:hypothetical protein